MDKPLLLKISDLEFLGKKISFSIFFSDLLIIYGPNGSGKTTLLKKIVFSRKVPSTFSYLGHKFGVKRSETIREYLEFSSYIAKTKIRLSEMIYFLDRYQLDSNIKIENLSFGQIQKVGLVRVLLSQKTLWILDEPFSNIDNQAQELFFQDLGQHLSLQGGALIVTHDTVPLTHESIYLS